MSVPPKDMIQSFRVSDLQSVLIFAGKNKNGKKNELMHRVQDLLKYRDPNIESKIREIYSHRRPRYEPRDPYPLKDSVIRSFDNRPLFTDPQSNYPRYSSRSLLHHPDSLQSRREIPVTPDVRIKALSFYKTVDVLLKPTSILDAPSDKNFPKTFVFHLSPQQVTLLLGNTYTQVQMRMCLLDTNSEQTDEVPSNVKVYINKNPCSLPKFIPTNKQGVAPMRQKLPVDITSLCKKSSLHQNIIEVYFDLPYPEKLYVITVSLVNQLFAEDLMRKLKDKGVRNPDHTTAMIKEKLREDIDNEIDNQHIRGPLTCPLLKTKMSFPCRAITCTHIQCFDALTYLKMNEKKTTWACPICNSSAEFKSLAIDGLFFDIIQKVQQNCNEVQFTIDGAWNPVIPVKKQPETAPPICDSPKSDIAENRKVIEVIELDDSDDDWQSPPPKKRAYVPSSSNSPVLLDSPDQDTDLMSIQDIADESIMILDSDMPSTSSIISPGFNPLSAFKIPEKSSLDPLPASLDIDVDCIVRDSLPIMPMFGSKTSAFSKPSSSKDNSYEVLVEHESILPYNPFSFSPNDNDEFTVSTSEDDTPDIISID